MNTPKKALCIEVSQEEYDHVKNTADSFGVSMSKLMQLSLEAALMSDDGIPADDPLVVGYNFWALMQGRLEKILTGQDSLRENVLLIMQGLKNADAVGYEEEIMLCQELLTEIDAGMEETREDIELASAQCHATKAKLKPRGAMGSSNAEEGR